MQQLDEGRHRQYLAESIAFWLHNASRKPTGGTDEPTVEFKTEVIHGGRAVGVWVTELEGEKLGSKFIVSLEYV